MAPRPLLELPEAREGQRWQCRDQKWQAVIYSGYAGALRVKLYTSPGLFWGSETIVRVVNSKDASYRHNASHRRPQDLVNLLFDPVA